VEDTPGDSVSLGGGGGGGGGIIALSAELARLKVELEDGLTKG